MAPTPKPPGQRVRRNKDQPKYRELPATGREGDAPALPKKRPSWLKPTKEWWATIWASPMATAWHEADVDGLVRLATLKDEFTRGTLPISGLSAIQTLEDRYGLNPKSRQQMLWQISKGEEPSERPPAEVRTLRAV